MKLLVISSKVCWPSTEKPTIYEFTGGFPYQIRSIAELFDGTELIVMERRKPEPSGLTPLECNDIKVNPIPEPPGNTELILKVSLDGNSVEAVPLSLEQPVEPVQSGILNYLPGAGWQSGVYTFQTELYIDGQLCGQSTAEYLEVNAETATKVVNWVALLIIIGSMVAVIIFTVIRILSVRRDMLYA